MAFWEEGRTKDPCREGRLTLLHPPPATITSHLIISTGKKEGSRENRHCFLSRKSSSNLRLPGHHPVLHPLGKKLHPDGFFYTRKWKAWDTHRCSTHRGMVPPQRCSPDDGDTLDKAELAVSGLYTKKHMKTPKETEEQLNATACYP